LCAFIFYSSSDPRDLHSFPTRRSSDLFISCLALAFGLFWLVWILGVLFYEGGAALLRASLYYQMTPPPGSDGGADQRGHGDADRDRKSTRLNSSHVEISYAVFCLKKKK